MEKSWLMVMGVLIDWSLLKYT